MKEITTITIDTHKGIRWAINIQCVDMYNLSMYELKVIYIGHVFIPKDSIENIINRRETYN